MLLEDVNIQFAARSKSATNMALLKRAEHIELASPGAVLNRAYCGRSQVDVKRAIHRVGSQSGLGVLLCEIGRDNEPVFTSIMDHRLKSSVFFH
jgi:hypothetical protein